MERKSVHSQSTTGMGWVARIITIAAILFVSMFAMDAFSHGDSVWQKLAAFGMHMIPSVALLLLLIVAWKRELLGGILLCLVGLGLAPFIYNMNVERTGSALIGIQVIAMINLPFILAGFLFIVSSVKRK